MAIDGRGKSSSDGVPSESPQVVSHVGLVLRVLLGSWRSSPLPKGQFNARPLAPADRFHATRRRARDDGSVLAIVVHGPVMFITGEGLLGDFGTEADGTER